MSNNEQDPLWLKRWKQEGIRYLGKDSSGHIDHFDRWEQAYKTGSADGVVEGKQEAFELCVGLLYHTYQTLKTFHGKNDERCLVLKNAILEIRHAQGEEMDQ